MTPEERAAAAYPCHPDCAIRAYHVKRCIHAALPGLLTEMAFHIRAAERDVRAELARCSDQPAPQNPPPSPTGDSE
jgi:hypothetical protein